MNRKEVFLKCQQCINDIQTAANSKTFIKYRKEQITLRYFFVRNRQMLSVIQTDADMVPVLHFVFLTNDIRAVPVYMYQLLPGDFPSTVPPYPSLHRSLEIASTFIRWHELSANFQFDIRWYD